MNRIFAIARTTVLEAGRNKVFYAILFFAVLMIGSSFVATEFTIHDLDRVLIDVGTGAMDFFGVLVTIFLGITLVSREVDRKTVYTVVTKPLNRSEFVLGKALGLAGVVTLAMVCMFAVLATIVGSFALDPVPWSVLVWYLLLALAELGIILSFSVLMSSFSSSALAAFFTIGLYVIGHATHDLHWFARKADPDSFARRAIDVAYHVLPDLSRFSVADQLTYGDAVDPATALLSMAYGAGWGVAFLVAAVIVFQRRDLK